MFSAPTFYFSPSVWLISLWPTSHLSDHFCVHSSEPQRGHGGFADIATSLYVVILIPSYILFLGAEMGRMEVGATLGIMCLSLATTFEIYSV